MIKGSSLVNKSKKAINDELRREFILASKDETFAKLCNRLKNFLKYAKRLNRSFEI